MKDSSRKRLLLLLLGLLLVALDQITKILVKTNMCVGDSIPVIGDFLRICYVENVGMAFGFAWGGVVGKIALSVFRIGLFAFLVWWISSLVKKGAPTGVLVGLSVIAAGALGNIIDCWFYGLIFDEAPFLMGKVVDMISFSIFPPVFNVADSCVTCGAAYLVLFQWKFFAKNDEKKV